MDDSRIVQAPAALAAIASEAEAAGFTMASEPRVGALLAVLAASKPRSRCLELGTGTGHATAWILAGLDAVSRLDTVDTDAAVQAVAKRHLRGDPRVTFHAVDGAEFIGRAARGSFDLIYADAWPGKFSHLDETLSLLRAGGLYVIDDLLPQPNWAEGHAARIPPLMAALEGRPGYAALRLAWASGLMIVARTNGPAG